jgi:diacylglycerol kinase family enzyme
MTSAEAAAARAGQRVAVIANMEKISEQDACDLRRSLEGYGVNDLDWFKLQQGADVRQSAARAVQSGAHSVVVCGGDGSVRLAAEALTGTGVALSVMPQGTGNAFVAGLGLPTDLDEIAKAVAMGGRQTIDTGMCNGNTFNLIAGSGFDVGMMAPTNEEKGRLGVLAYVGAAIGEMLHRRSFHVHVTIDDTSFYDGPSTGVLVGKLGSTRGAIKTFPDASPTDGLLHVAVVTAVGPLQWLGLTASLLMSRHETSSQAEFGQGAKVSVAFRKRRRFELDGDILGRAATLECHVEPRSLVICRPPEV